MNNIMSEFDRLLGGPLIPIGDHAVISVFPHKEFFVLGMRCGDAVGKLLDLGQIVLLKCNITFDKYNFQYNKTEALFACNYLNRDSNWLKLILNEDFKLELKAEGLINKNGWYNEVLRLLADYVSVASVTLDNVCEEYGELDNQNNRYFL